MRGLVHLEENLRRVCSQGYNPSTGTMQLLWSWLVVVVVTASAAGFEPMLFMDLDDVEDGWGLLEPLASTVTPSNQLRPPPLSFTAGSLVIAVIEAETPGTFEVYGENTTGWEPLDAHASGTNGVGGSHDCALLRYTT